VHGFFYNPNIHPYVEFQKRLETLRHFADLQQLPVIVHDSYDLEGFLRHVVFREEQRCIYCYASRLEAAARIARKGKFDAFTTTLLYSKRQKHELVMELAVQVAKQFGISFHYEDFRVGWKEGQQEAKRLDLYRQQYCGCIYSEKERFCNTPVIRKGADI
jgi:hypothetical protein